MTMTFINTDSAEMRRCADAVSAAVKPATYTNVAVSRVCSFYSGDSTLAIASLPAVNSTSHLSSSVAGSTLSVQTFSYMMLGSAASVLWTLIWIGTVTTCITGDRLCTARVCVDVCVCAHCTNVHVAQQQPCLSGTGKAGELALPSFGLFTKFFAIDWVRSVFGLMLPYVSPNNFRLLRFIVVIVGFATSHSCIFAVNRERSVEVAFLLSLLLPKEKRKC
jgi:hypothetical protein